MWPVPIGTQQDVDEAVVSAQKAFESWSEVPFEKRKEMIKNFKDYYMQFSDDMTTLLCQETGKPKYIAEAETKGVAGFFDHHLSLELPEESMEDDEKTLLTRYTPLGVVGAICP